MNPCGPLGPVRNISVRSQSANRVLTVLYCNLDMINFIGMCSEEQIILAYTLPIAYDKFTMTNTEIHLPCGPCGPGPPGPPGNPTDPV